MTAQLAYAYPLLAQVADLRGDAAFADQLRSLGDRDLAQLRREWTGRGWYARGYLGLDQVGTGAIYLEPQPWAILAGAPDADQAATLVGNIERYLQGRGAPPELGGPTRIGTSQSPARADPDVTETDAVDGVGDGNAVYVGGTWYALNGPLTWALGELAGEVAGAAQQGVRRAQAQHPRRARRGLSRPLDRDPQRRRRLQLVLLVGARAVRHPAAARPRRPAEQRPDHPSARLGPVRGAEAGGDPAHRRRVPDRPDAAAEALFDPAAAGGDRGSPGVDARLRPHRLGGEASARARPARERLGEVGAGLDRRQAGPQALGRARRDHGQRRRPGGDRLVDWALRY